MKIGIAIFLAVIPAISFASDMAGVGLAFSIPITGFLFITSLVVAIMAETKTGYWYIVLAIVLSLSIAVSMSNYKWVLDSDIESYWWHLLLTIAMVIPPSLLKYRLNRKKT